MAKRLEATLLKNLVLCYEMGGWSLAPDHDGDNFAMLSAEKFHTNKILVIMARKRQMMTEL